MKLLQTLILIIRMTTKIQSKIVFPCLGVIQVGNINQEDNNKIIWGKPMTDSLVWVSYTNNNTLYEGVIQTTGQERWYKTKKNNLYKSNMKHGSETVMRINKSTYKDLNVQYLFGLHKSVLRAIFCTIINCDWEESDDMTIIELINGILDRPIETPLNVYDKYSDLE